MRRAWTVVGHAAVAALMVGLLVACGGEKTPLVVGPDQGAQPLAKLIGESTAMARAVVMVTLTDDGTPVEGATVAFSRSIAGRALDYAWEGTTDAGGKARVEVLVDAPLYSRSGASGYYLAKATDGTSGDTIGQWGSIPINGEHPTMLRLPVSGPAKVLEGRLVVDDLSSPSLEGNPLGNPAHRKMTIYLPPTYGESGKRYPVIYLLHGFTGDYRTWVCSEFRGMYWPPGNDFPKRNLNGMLDDLIANGQMTESIVVMPDGSSLYGGAFYTDSVLNGSFETYIIKDVVGYVDAHYRTISDRDSRAIAGHSMGGYGAMRLAMRHPDVFCAVASHAGPLYVAAMQPMVPMVVAENPDGLVGPDPGRPLTTLTYAIAAAWSPNLDLPPFYVDLPFDYPSGKLLDAVWDRWFEQDAFTMLSDYGTGLASLKGIWIDAGDQDDFGINYQIDAFHQALLAAGIPHHFEIFVGNHYNHVFEKLGLSLPYLSNLMVADE